MIASAGPCVTSPTLLTRSKLSAPTCAYSSKASTQRRLHFFDMLAVFAQFETDVRRERQAEGIVKDAGIYTGAKPRINRERVLALVATGVGPAAAARALGVSRMPIYRILDEHNKA